MAIQNPTLILGLGGTGFNIASQVKEIAYQEGETEETTSLKYLCLDFDSYSNNNGKYTQKFGKNSKLSENECLYISENDVETEYKKNLIEPGDEDDIQYFDKDCIKGVGDGDQERRKKITQRILDSNLNLQSGAGQVRINGKIGISYSDHFEKTEEELIRVIDKLAGNNIAGWNNFGKISIYVYSSSAGASGSGMLLEILLMLNKLDVNRRIEVFNFMILPDPYIREYKGKVRKFLAYPNTYGTITELEYLYENIYDFKGTRYDEKGLKELRLPQMNFLIDDTAFGGGSAGNFSLEKIYYSTARFTHTMLMGFLDSDIKNVKTQTMNGKNSIFSSIGYSEVSFDLNRLNKYARAEILKLAENKNSTSLNINSSNDSFTEIFDVINSILKEPKENFLNSEFSNEFKEMKFKHPPHLKKYFKKLKDNTNTNKSTFINDIKSLVNSHYNSDKLSNQVNKAIQIISKVETDDELINQKNSFIRELEKLILKEKDADIVKKSELIKKINTQIKDITVIPSTYKASFIKFRFSTKKEFYSVHLKKKIKLIETYLNELKNIESKNELIRLINNTINTESIPSVQDSKMANLLYGYNLLNKSKTNTKLIDKEDNVINLEASFQTKIDSKILEDPKIDKYLYSKLISCTNKDKFDITLANLDVFQYLNNQLSEMNILQLKDELNSFNSNSVSMINKNLKYISNPLWDRFTNNEIAKGGVVRGRFESHKWIALPINDNNLDFFGKELINSDPLISSNKHRQSIFSIEIGLPAHAVKNIKAYQKEFKSETKSDLDKSIKFFAYDEIRVKCLNETSGIFIIEDKELLEKRARAMKVWSLGWAFELIVKKDKRYKFIVGTEFKVSDTNKTLYNQGVYDPFKEFGQTNKLDFLFNKFLTEHKLIDTLEEKITQEMDKDPKKFLEIIEDRFCATSTSNFVQKFKTEKKSLHNLPIDEQALLNDEEKTLVNESVAFAEDKGIYKSQFYFEEVQENNGNTFRRAKTNF